MDKKEISVSDLQAKIKELEEKVKAGEEGALNRVCKALGVSPESVAEPKTSQTDNRMIECFIGTAVNVNGRVYRGKVTVPFETFHVIQQAIGDRRMRLLKELTGNNYVIDELSNSHMTPRLVGTVDQDGSRIA